MINVKKFVDTLGDKPVAVFGLGISNIAAIKALLKAGAKIEAWDDNATNHPAAKDAGAELVDLANEDMSKYGCLVLAPGVPLYHPEPHDVVKAARKAEIEILCDLEILHRCEHGRKTIGITGTNGKSTTTALIGHVLKECGIDVVVGGNIGKAALELTQPKKDGVFVLEMSSFQLDLCNTFAPDIGVLLNVTPDHLDRHGTMQSYADAKEKIFKGSGYAVTGVDDEWTKRIYESVKSKGERSVIPVSIKESVKGGIYVQDGNLHDATGQDDETLFALDITTLPGAHNHQNAACAYAVCRLMGLEKEAIHEAMKTFPGLPHRQYLVRTINGVAYVNDSKATNADAAARALACYKNIYWIVGGKPKEGGLNGLEPYIERIKHAFLIGEAMEEFASWLDNQGVPHNFSGTIDKAVEEAHHKAQSERGEPGGTGTVLLSPACASFDQFKNFEDRGDQFTAHVNGLKEDAG